MLDQPQRQGLTLAWKAGDDMRPSNGSGEPNDKARRFRDAALPHLDDVYTLARYLLRNGADDGGGASLRPKPGKSGAIR
jgi:hypothetical protein